MCTISRLHRHEVQEPSYQEVFLLLFCWFRVRDLRRWFLSPKCSCTREGSPNSGNGTRGNGKGKLAGNQEEGNDLKTFIRETLRKHSGMSSKKQKRLGQVV